MREAILWGAALLAGFAAVAYFTEAPAPPRRAVARARAPARPAAAAGVLAKGRALFEENCAACHGREAAGTRIGPPLVHKVYEPSHHADAAFFLAVRRGVKAHHWEFGDMPPLPGLKREDVVLIVRYVRDLQRKAGIF